jgi:glutamate carboxypeptidase
MNPKQLLKTLVETESSSHDKAAVNRVGAIVAEEAFELGANVEIISSGETGDHLILRFNPGRQDENKKKPILLLCHMDTVFPLDTLASMPYREADGKIYGPGILDMKAGIVISLGAIEDAGIAGLIRPVTLLCTSDEEIGSPTSRDLIESLATESALVLVMEPALVDGSLKTWRKGVGKFQVTTRGHAAHAGGDHEKGRNAIEEMAHQIIAIQKLTDYSRQTTLNVGAIQGGTVSNVVPEQCAVEVDVRVMQPGEWDRLEWAMGQLKPVLDGTSIEISGSLNRPPMPFDETMKTTFERAQAIAKSIGMELRAGGTGGASDANFVAPLGIPVLDGLGAVGEGYHSDREYIFADSLEQKIKLVSSLLRDW